MKTQELEYDFPENLIALKPDPNFRILLSKKNSDPQEISKTELFDLFHSGDLLVVNNTRVLPRRIFTEDNKEILFLENDTKNLNQWQVLFPSRDVKEGQILSLPGDMKLKLLKKGLPQTVEIISQELTESYFAKYGELALPPYIQKARGIRKPSEQDKTWYQTEWAKISGSLAAPTASLHFTNDDLTLLKQKGVVVCEITLHVGIGTFLPIKVSDLKDHVMHKEWAHIPPEAIQKIQAAKKVWALGTTSVRTLESWAHGFLKPDADGGYSGFTDLFITPGFEFKLVRGLLTNFHQPSSTLLALVSAFAGLSHVKKAYDVAIKNRFRLFSYGDLSVWLNE